MFYLKASPKGEGLPTLPEARQLGTTVLGDLIYTYDAAGNRTKIGGTFARTGVPQAITTANYNAANQQLALADKSMKYDNNGNLTSLTDANGTTDYSWNARNQLVGISGPGVSAAFEYDGLGRRQSKIINASTTEFLYDGVNPVQEKDGIAVLANVLTGLGVDEFLTRTDVMAGTTSYFLSDALGSVLALSDSSGAVQTEYTYEPFGKTAFTGPASTNPFQYTGRENDATGLYYYRARYYHPTGQRFASEDPIEFRSRDYNLYAYVKNRPVNYIDPSGLIEIPAALKGQLISEILQMVVTAGMGGITGAACASEFCRQNRTNVDWWDALSKCFTIFHQAKIAPGSGLGTGDLVTACADECERITRTSRFKEFCCKFK